MCVEREGEIMVSQLHIEYYNDTGKTVTFIYHKLDVQKKMVFHMTNYVVLLMSLCITC